MPKFNVTVSYQISVTHTAEVDEVEANDENMAVAIVKEMDAFGGLNWKAEEYGDMSPYSWDVENQAGGSTSWSDDE